MTGAPVWLLDVDGVVNATRPRWSAAPRQVTLYPGGGGMKIRYAPALAMRIRRLHTTGSVQVRWCSTWCLYPDQLARLEALLCLPPLVPAFTERPVDMGEAKLAAARQVLAAGSRLVWTDDDEVPEQGEVYDELTADGRALLIRPRPRDGLLPVDLDRIEAWSGLQ